MKTVLATAILVLGSSAMAAEDFRDEGVWDRHETDVNTANVTIHMHYDLAAYEESAFDVGQFGRVEPSSVEPHIGSEDLAYQEGTFDIPG